MPDKAQKIITPDILTKLPDWLQANIKQSRLATYTFTEDGQYIYVYKNGVFLNKYPK